MASIPSQSGQAAIAQQMAQKNEIRQIQLIAGVSVCFLLAYLAVGLRLMARRRVRQPIMADDWWIIAGLVRKSAKQAIKAIVDLIHWILTTFLDGFSVWSINAGLARHVINPTHSKTFIQATVACMVLYSLCFPPVKSSVLLLYHRIFPGKWIKIASIVIATIVTGP
jgi:hypothetical protein